MLRGIYSAASGLIYNQSRQDVCANNIANSSTYGFKQDIISTQPFPEVIIQNYAAGNGETGSMPLGVMSGEIKTDFSQGPIIGTENQLDFAIEGRGFFTLQLNDGAADTEKYTRDGSFNVDSAGMLVNSSGGYLMGKNLDTGAKEPIYTNGEKITVDKNGIININSKPTYSIDISDFNDYSILAKEDKNMYTSTEQPIKGDKSQYKVMQGSLENSNTDITSEMVNMIVNLRSFQANQKVIQSLNDTLGKTVNDVGALR